VDFRGKFYEFNKNMEISMKNPQKVQKKVESVRISCSRMLAAQNTGEKSTEI
jgi:hypothetical protein